MFGIFPENDYQQTLRLKRFLMAFASYLMWSIIALVAFLLKIIPGSYSILLGYLSGILLCNVLIYTLIRSGFNKRFKDPSLTLLQMMIATFWIMVFAYYADSARSVVLLVYLITFVFGLFKLNLRQYLFLSAFAVINYAVVILLLYINHPESVNGKIDVLNIIVLAMVLPWFASVGGYITGLRAKVNKAFSTIQETELRFRTIFDSASDGILLVKISDKKFYAANKKMCAMTGYDHNELLQRGISDLHPQDRADFSAHQFHLLLKEKNVSLNNIPLIKKDGSQFFADITASVMIIEGEEYFLGMFRDITERKQSEELIKKSETQYRLLADHMKDQVWLMDLNLNVHYISPSVERILGYKLDELQSLTLDKLFTPASLEAASNFFSTEMPKARVAPPDYILTRSLELEFIRKDGHRLWGECMFSFIRDNNGKPISVLGESRDITDRKKMEDKLRFEEERFRALVEHSSDIIVLVNRDGMISYINPAVEKLLGFTPEERIGQRGFELFHPDDQTFIMESFVSLISNPSAAPIQGVMRLRHKNGSYRYIEGVGSSLVRNDVVEGVILNYRDVTERKESEEKLYRSEQRYRTVLEDINEGYFEVDLAGNFTFFNDTLVRVSGYSRDELMGMNNRQYTDKEELKKVYEAYNQVYTTGQPNKELVWKIRTKEGSFKYIEGSISLLKGSSGKPIGFRGIAHDITEHMKIEKKLREEEQRFRTLSEQSSDIIVLLNHEGKIIYENRAIEKILGLKAAERIGATGLEYLHPDDFKLVLDTYNLLLNDVNASEQRADLRFRHADGSWRTFEVVAGNLIHDHIIESVMINLRDITERKQAEEKLQKTLESLKKAVGTTIQVLVTALESRDPYTAGHQSRAAHLACAIAAELGLSEDTAEGIRMAGIIHDIGKLAVPAEILTKPSKLTKLEFSLIKEHSHSGFEMLKDVESPWPLAEIVYQHHERINGSGYPRNMMGDEILLEARILAVSDVVESMASHRPYRAALGVEAALEEIEKNKGVLYDTAVADACLRLFRERGYHLP